MLIGKVTMFNLFDGSQFDYYNPYTSPFGYYDPFGFYQNNKKQTQERQPENYREGERKPTRQFKMNGTQIPLTESALRAHDAQTPNLYVQTIPPIKVEKVTKDQDNVSVNSSCIGISKYFRRPEPEPKISRWRKCRKLFKRKQSEANAAATKSDQKSDKKSETSAKKSEASSEVAFNHKKTKKVSHGISSEELELLNSTPDYEDLYPAPDYEETTAALPEYSEN